MPLPFAARPRPALTPPRLDTSLLRHLRNLRLLPRSGWITLQRAVLPVLLAATLSACGTAPVLPQDDAAGREAMLQTVWTTLGERHVDAPPPGWDTAISRHRAAVLAAPPLAQDPEALWIAVDRLAAEWRDAHTRVDTPRDVARQTRFEVVTPGFGLQPIGGVWVAHRVDPQSAAHAAGLRDGLLLRAWNGEPPEAVWARLQQTPRTSSTPQATASRSIRRWLDGAPGTVVPTRWERPDGSMLNLNVERRMVQRPPSWSLVRRDSGVAVLRWSHFDTRLEAPLMQAMAQLGPDVRALVLDLRGNGGGSFAMTQRLAGALLSGNQTGAIVGTKGKPGEATRLTGLGLYGGPVAVLLDRESASGSELLARTLQALGRARVVGETSCGCLLSVSRHLMLGTEARLAVSEGHIRWPEGRVEGVGVQPDLAVERTLAGVQAGRDEVLDAAERALLQAAGG